ncbi:hypothetical protein BT96DRAFT_915428 [Gymnopus androsaceus JB14]|uniref:Uncharacterized protein n=1 Tax=Gymnopus androsaceus JB14 TaxID=1447944 RepID=A0A6A4I7B6_9AGAR|nr:hypothetical protein BT96DRAFT_915428 [Gymnopus androsaceus JB14]
MSSSSGTTILVDDADPRIVYSAGWLKEGLPGLECEGTTHGSNFIPGATATFTFEGVGVQVFGSVGSPDGSPKSTYQVDGAVPSTFTFNANGLNNYHLNFYSSPALDPGNHTLIMTSIGNNTTEIFLDYIVYNPMPSSSSTSSLISTSSAVSSGDPATVTTPMPLASAVSSSDPATVTTPIPIASAGHVASSSAGAIAGGVVGAVAGLALGLVLMYTLMRRRIRELKGRLEANHNVIEPYPTSVLDSSQFVTSRNLDTVSDSLVMAKTSCEFASTVGYSGHLCGASIPGAEQLGYGYTEQKKLSFSESSTGSQTVY